MINTCTKDNVNKYKVNKKTSGINRFYKLNGTESSHTWMYQLSYKDA